MRKYILVLGILLVGLICLGSQLLFQFQKIRALSLIDGYSLKIINPKLLEGYLDEWNFFDQKVGWMVNGKLSEKKARGLSFTVSDNNCQRGELLFRGSGKVDENYLVKANYGENGIVGICVQVGPEMLTGNGILRETKGFSKFLEYYYLFSIYRLTHYSDRTETYENISRELSNRLFNSEAKIYEINKN